MAERPNAPAGFRVRFGSKAAARSAKRHVRLALKATCVALAPRKIPIETRFHAKAASAGWFGSSVDRSAEGN